MAFDTTIPLLGIYFTNIFTQIFIAVLLAIAKTKPIWKQVINSKLIKEIVGH